MREPREPRWTTDAALRRELSEVEPPDPPPRTDGPRGIVTGAGDAGTLLNAYLMLHRVRYLGCDLPAVVFHAGDEVVPDAVRSAFPSGTTFRRLPDDVPGGWHLKPFALHLAPFDRVLWLDADTLLLKNPAPLFDRPEEAVFWPDMSRYTDGSLLEAFGVEPHSLELETGQVLLQPDAVARSLWATCLLNREYRTEVAGRLLGDKDTFRLGFAATGRSWTTVHHLPAVVGDHGWEVPIRAIGETLKIRGAKGPPLEIGLLQHDLDGEPLLLHRTMREWRAWDLEPQIRWCAAMAAQGEVGERDSPSAELLELEAWALERIPEADFFSEALGRPAMERLWLKHRFNLEAGLSLVFSAAHRLSRPAP